MKLQNNLHTCSGWNIIRDAFNQGIWQLWGGFRSTRTAWNFHEDSIQRLSGGGVSW